MKKLNSNKVLKIGSRKIGPGFPCFIIAELSGNHHQKFSEAVKLIKSAAKAGADAVKLQTYTPDTITLNSDKKWFLVGGIENPKDWQKKTLYELYQTAYTSWEWQPKLKKIAEDLGLIFFSTPFDETAVDFLEEMDVPCYKVASYEVVDIPLLKKIAKTKKPIIMSVGFADLPEVELAVNTLKKNGASQIAVLHCVTGYSDKPKLEEMNLRTILDIRERFGLVSGFSDNNAGIEIPTIAALTGASIIEKHLTLKRSKGGPDSQFSIEPSELARMIKNIRRAEKAMGSAHYGPASPAEEYNKRFRPSIFSTKNIRKGERFTKNNTGTFRPDNGIAPRDWDKVIGKKAKYNIDFATPLSWKLIEK